MKINFNDYDLENFLIKEGTFCGIPCKLIQPNHIGTKFTQKNKIFRSSLWDLEGNLISAGFPKFVNFGENPENFPVPTSLNNCKILEKIDGSLCICDYVNGHFSSRTRGTFEYKQLENYKDFEYCFQNNPNIEKWIKSNSNYTLLFEITTPNMKIVIDYGDIPQLRLIGCVNKDDYSLLNQYQLDVIGEELNIIRPKYFQFDNLEEMISKVEKFVNLEGVCLYSKDDQEIHKIKGLQYLTCLYFKSNATFESTLDLFLEHKFDNYKAFEEFLVTTFDWECFNMVRGYVSNILDSKKEVDSIIKGMDNFVDKIKKLSTRKEQATQITSAYGTTNRTSMAFLRLDGKELSKEHLKKLYFQVSKI